MTTLKVFDHHHKLSNPLFREDGSLVVKATVCETADVGSIPIRPPKLSFFYQQNNQ